MSNNTPNTVRPTKKQREILSFIEDFIKEHGYSPSYREIMNGLEYTSVATVSLHVNSLIRRGHLAKRDRSARSLEVVHSSGAPTAVSSKPSGSTPGGVVGTGGGATKSNEELWLEDKIDAFVTSLTTSELSPDNVLKLQVVHEATRLLGLDALAEETGSKLAALQARLAADESAA